MIPSARFLLRWISFGLLLSTPLFAQPLRQPLLDAWQEKMTASMKALKNGQPAEAIKLCDEAVEMARHFGPEDIHLARSEVQRAHIYIWEKKYDEAEKMFNEAIAHCEHSLGPNSPELVHPLSSLANFYYYTKSERDRAVKLLERILDIVEHGTVRDDQQVIMWARNLAQVHQEMGHPELAEPLFLHALALTEKAEPEWLTHQQLTVAQFYRSWKKYDRAENLAHQALESREKALKGKPDNVDAKLDVAVALDELGAIHFATGQLEPAEAECRRSLQIVDTFMTPDQSDLRPRLLLLGDVLCARKKYDEASNVYRRLVTVTEKCAGADSVELADDLTKYAAVLRELKKSDEAGRIESRVEQIRKKASTASA